VKPFWAPLGVTGIQLGALGDHIAIAIILLFILLYFKHQLLEAQVLIFQVFLTTAFGLNLTHVFLLTALS
jgi:hypothetical protein